MKLKAAYFGWFFLAVLIVLSLLAEKMTGYAFDRQDAESILFSPSGHHCFRTNSFGRDVFTRVFYGARVSLFVAIFSSFLTMLLGVTFGSLAGWFEGFVEQVLIRSIDVLQAIPSFLLISLLCLFLQTTLDVGDFSFKTLFAVGVSISLVHWFNIAKVARGQIKQLKVLSYVEAARALGATPFRIFRHHLLPNMKSTLWVLFAMQIPASILYESIISFAGYGLQSPQVSHSPQNQQHASLFRSRSCPWQGSES
jgi:oligopeptide transport system permease protein